MLEVFKEAKKQLEAGEPFVLASVVKTTGSTPQKPGAKLLVRRDGTIVGTLGGGCVEADVWAVAKEMLASASKPQVWRFELNEDIAAQDGLVCGGVMEILVDPIRDASLAPLVDEILAAFDGHGARALATLVSNETNGEVTRAAKAFVHADGNMVGSLGAAELDELATSSALEQMPRGGERWLETSGCRIFVEAFNRPPTVVIVGGGHVGKALYHVADFLGFRTIVIDDREKFASHERFPNADRVILSDFDHGITSLDLGPNHSVVVATRGHKLDDVALIAAARSGAGYVGLLGSKRKAVLIFRDLLAQGIPTERVREIRAPVGLNLGGRQPEEIAVSVMAEVLAHHHARDGAPLTMGAEVVSKLARSMTLEAGSDASSTT